MTKKFEAPDGDPISPGTNNMRGDRGVSGLDVAGNIPALGETITVSNVSYPN
ncbi:MAG: hypothetical protein ACKO1W_00560 [Microcystaceae cyanobacterium]